MQLVGCVEGGRVADEYDLGELFSDWKFDAGAGLRFLMSGGVIRLDFAVSDEGSQVWAMFGQPF
jgi:outer membrane translocation and assembly module TamA